MLETVINVLLWVVIIFVIGWVAHWVITTFLPEPIRTPALLIVGVLLLIVILVALLKGLPGGRPLLRWP